MPTKIKGGARRWLSILLALAMILSTAPVPASAAAGDLTAKEVKLTGIYNSQVIGNAETQLLGFIPDWPEGYIAVSPGLIPWSDDAPATTSEVNSAYILLDMTREALILGGGEYAMPGLRVGDPSQAPPGDYRFVVYAQNTAALPDYEEEIFYGTDKVVVIDGSGFPYDLAATTLEITEGGAIDEATELTLVLDLGTAAPVSLTGSEILDLMIYSDDGLRYGADFSGAAVSPGSISLMAAENAFVSMRLPAMTVVGGKLTIAISDVVPLVNDCEATIKFINSDPTAPPLGHWEGEIRFTGEGGETPTPALNLTASTLTAPGGATVNQPTGLTLTLKPSADISVEAGDTVTLEATGIDFLSALAPENFTVTLRQNGRIVLTYKAAETLPAAGTEILIADARPTIQNVSGAKVTLARAGESDLTRTFPALGFLVPSLNYENCRLEVTLANNTWVAPTSGVFSAPIEAAVRLLDENDEVVDVSCSVVFHLDGWPYLGLNGRQGSTSINLEHGQGTLDVESLTSFKGDSEDAHYTFRSYAYLYDPSIRATRILTAENAVTVSMAVRTLTGHVSLNTGSATVPYANADITVSRRSHTGYSAGFTSHPLMLIAAKTDANGDYSVDLPSPYADSIDSETTLYSVTVPESAENRTMQASTSSINWSDPDAPVAGDILAERMVRIFLKIYDHAVVPDGSVPDWEADRRDQAVDEQPSNLITDPGMYTIYSYPSGMSRNQNMLFANHARMNALTDGGENPFRLQFNPAAYLRRLPQYYTAEIEYSPGTDDYTMYVDFLPDGYIEVVNPDTFEGNTDGTGMAVRVFYQRSSYWSASSSALNYLSPGQRLSYGQYRTDTEVAALVVPKEFAGYLASTDYRNYYDADTGEWSVPRLFDDEYIVLAGTAGLGKKVSLRDAALPAGDSTKHGEVPDNAAGRVVGVNGNSVTVAFRFSSIGGDFQLGHMYIKQDEGLLLNAGEDSHYYLLPDQTRAAAFPQGAPYVYLGQYRPEGYGMWNDWYGDVGGITVTLPGGQKKLYEKLYDGETLVVVMTFDLRNPDEPEGTEHSLTFSYDPGKGNGVAAVTARVVPMASLSFSASPNPTLAGDGYTEQNYMEISGSATADSDIALYVDGEPAKLIDLAKSTDTDRVYLDGSTVKTNKAGQYTAAAELYGGRSPAEIDPGEISEIYAVDGVRQTNSVFVRYAPGLPKVAALGDIKHKALLISLPWEEMTYLEPPPPGSAGGGGGGGTMAPTLLLSSTGDTIFEKFGVARASLVSVYVSGDNPNALGERLKDRTGWQWTQTVPVILRYDPGEDLEYRVIFDKNDDDISKVWVNIENAAGGNEYIMPAEYDSAKGYWLATGELPSVGFVPGLISVDYILKLGTDISLEEEALSALQNRPALNDPELLTALVNNELRTYTMPEGLLDDDNLADKMWRQLVEAVPDLAAISVTENPDETETVSYTTADGEESVTGKMWALDKTDPAVIALAEEMLEAESALPLGSNGWYTISAIVHYTQGGQEKTMPYENFLMLLSDYDSNADAMAALDIADSVKVAYTEMIRLPQAAAPQARSARLLPGSDQATPEGFDAYCTALDFSLSGLDLGKEALGITDDMLDVNIGGGKALNGANLLSAIGAALGLKDIVNNVNENCDIKYLFKQYNDLGNSLQSLSNTECFKSMSYEDTRAFYRIMDDYYKAYSKYNRWQRNNRMFNNGKVIFTSGAIIFSAMTMGAGGEGYVLTKLGEGVSRGITASGVALSAGDIAYGYLGSKEFTKLMISAHINNLNRFEAAFTRYMYKKCGRLNRTVTDPYRVKVVFDPSGFAYENGDLNQKVAGVLAEIWQADDAGGANARLWTEAAEYGEVNPQITGEDGWYAWDVPVGWWQVRLSKDGYQEARSEWLPVLPVQLGVNLELIPAGGDPGDGDGGGGGGGGGGAAAPPPPVSPETPWNNPFADVSAGDWFYGDVEYVYTKGLMNGTGADQFSPRLALTRGMIVTILHRLAGAPDVAGSADPFGDVASGQYYADAVKWAAANGIVSGVGGGKFAPDAAITRQDLAVVLNRYTGFAGMNLPAQRPYAAFNDSAAIADYAKAAVETFYSAGIINGVPGGLFNPKSGATRAEVAAMLHRFLETSGE